MKVLKNNENIKFSNGVLQKQKLEELQLRNRRRIPRIVSNKKNS
jgi:hypothetical protein